MHARHIVFFIFFITLVWGIPNNAFADTIITADSSIFEDTVWTKEGSPYLVQERLTIDQGATLSIQPGVVVQFYSYDSVRVLGRLLATGTSNEPIVFTSDTRWRGIVFYNPENASSLNHVVIRYANTAITDFYSKDLLISNVIVEEGKYGIEMYGSHLSLDNFYAEDISREALYISNVSDVTLKNITLKNVGAGIGIYFDSTANISNLFIDYPQYEALGLYDGSSMNVSSSTLTNGGDDAVGIYAGSTIDIKDSVISGFIKGAGIANYNSSDYATNSISLTRNEIKNNIIGISLYSNNSVYSISNNAIYQNLLYGLESYGTTVVDIRDNFWGDASGPYNDPDNLSGVGDEIYYVPESIITFSPWLTSWDPCVTTNTCVSNVLFLPGIQGSRLYRPDYGGGTDKLWEPNIDSDVQDLYMKPDGSSARFDVYTKERDVIDELPTGANIYKSFIATMNDLKTSGTINDWEPVAYDWRLSLDDILNYGNSVSGRIYYSGDLRATSTPYIIQELKRLAATSKTGKVAIVAHSNGGLLAKRLTELLGPVESARLIDKMIFIAVPQAGTPMAISAGLHGYGQDILFGLIISKRTARTFASTSPMMYHLLPSAQYFTYVDYPVVTFDTQLQDWIARYGSTIHSQEALQTFLTDSYGRVNSQTGDTNQPIQFSSSLLANAETLHTNLDNWSAPAGVELTQIAGWGVPKTVKGITYKKKGAGVAPEPNFTIDGDGTVVVPSALWTSTTTGATNYWVDLDSYNKKHPIVTLGGFHPFNHANILETNTALNFLSDKITNTTKSLPEYTYLSTVAPVESNKRLRYALHSPLTLNLYDDQGRHTGVSTTTGEVEEHVPGTYYTEFGEVKYIIAPTGSYSLIMNGQSSGTFSLDIQESFGDTVTNSSTIANVPTTAGTLASLTVSGGIDTVSALTVDENGDGESVITISPRIGETVNYEPPAVPEPVTIPSGGGGAGGGGVSPPVVVTLKAVASTTATTSPLVVDEPIVATSMQKVVTYTESVRVEKKQLATNTVHKVEKVETVIPKTNVPQTASVYDASQQSLITRTGAMLYTVFHEFLFAIIKFF